MFFVSLVLPPKIKKNTKETEALGLGFRLPERNEPSGHGRCPDLRPSGCQASEGGRALCREQSDLGQGADRTRTWIFLQRREVDVFLEVGGFVKA